MRQRRKVDSEYIFSVASNPFIPAVLAQFDNPENLLDHKSVRLAQADKIINRF